MSKMYKIPILLSPQPEGGYTVTSPLLPELVTEADSLEEVFTNVQDALKAVIELYEDAGKTLPACLRLDSPAEPFLFETLVAAS